MALILLCSLDLWPHLLISDMKIIVALFFSLFYNLVLYKKEYYHNRKILTSLCDNEKPSELVNSCVCAPLALPSGRWRTNINHEFPISSFINVPYQVARGSKAFWMAICDFTKNYTPKHHPSTETIVLVCPSGSQPFWTETCSNAMRTCADISCNVTESNH